jgi:hypothetical protein
MFHFRVRGYDLEALAALESARLVTVARLVRPARRRALLPGVGEPLVEHEDHRAGLEVRVEGVEKLVQAAQIHVREPESGQAGVEALGPGRGPIRVAPRELDGRRVALGPSEDEGVVVDVGGVDAPGALRSVARPVTRAAGHLEDAPARERGPNAAADPLEILLPPRARVDALVLRRPLGVVRDHLLGHAPSSRRTKAAPVPRACSLPRATARESGTMPQLVQGKMRAGGTCFRALRMTAATCSGVST